MRSEGIDRPRRLGQVGWSWLAAMALLAAAACGGDSSSSDQADRGECEPGALDDELEESDGPVEISFWIGMGDNAQFLEELIDEFHASQDRVRVDLLNNNGDREQQEAYLNAVRRGDVPDLVQHENIFLQKLIDTLTVLPVESCIEADEFDQSDYMERLTDYYVVDGVQWGLPFNINTPVLFYDRNIFEQAGLDPDEPPSTLDELYDYAEAIKDTGAATDAGMGLKEDGWLLEVFRALQGEPLVDNGNGRDGRATEAVFDDEVGQEILTVLNDLVQDGLARTNPPEGGSRHNNLVGMSHGQWGMTFDSSGSLGIALQVLESGELDHIDPAVAPLPGLAEDGGVPVGGGGLFISSGDPVRQAAAWEFAQFLTSPSSQAFWGASTGFIPVRESALEEQVLIDAWDESPFMRVAYDQALAGEVNEASAGAVIGEYRDVRRTMEQVVSTMFRGESTPQQALSRATEQINGSLETYNDRIAQRPGEVPADEEPADEDEEPAAETDDG